MRPLPVQVSLGYLAQYLIDRLDRSAALLGRLEVAIDATRERPAVNCASAMGSVEQHWQWSSIHDWAGTGAPTMFGSANHGTGAKAECDATGADVDVGGSAKRQKLSDDAFLVVPMHG